MGITSAIVLFAVIWFLVLFVTLPFMKRTQAEAGQIEPGTHASAPADFNPRRTALVVTVISTVLWALIAGTIISGAITVRDLDFFGRMGPAPEAAGPNE
ncbi:DUF1467 family protein [Actibacterium ureilyticum]|uniref:DUF1467 family protein n=1 Tax=Actibacterium ureilyticum TaxID=1590614 RepID=UPI000BAABC7D|nr:DUF1467 family protein [Actibacterium ureilyticum]